MVAALVTDNCEGLLGLCDCHVNSSKRWLGGIECLGLCDIDAGTRGMARVLWMVRVLWNDACRFLEKRNAPSTIHNMTSVDL